MPILAGQVFYPIQENVVDQVDADSEVFVVHHASGTLGVMSQQLPHVLRMLEILNIEQSLWAV
jgi:hypothetical protein